VLDGEGGVGPELVGALKPLGLAWLGRCAAGIGKAAGDLLEDGYLVVERLEVDAAVHVPGGLVGDGVAHAHAVDGGAAVPAVGGVVAHIAGEEVDGGNLAERSAVLRGEGLIVAPRRAHRENRLPHGVFPLAVLVGEELAVDRAQSLLDACVGIGVEAQVEALGDVPGQRELAVPEEILAHRHGQLEHLVDLRAGLLLVVVARHVGEKRDIVGQPLQLPLAQEFEILVLRLDEGERLEGAYEGRVGVLERAAVVVGVLVLGGGVLTVLLVEREVEREVGGVPGHRCLALHVKLEARDGEVLHREAVDGVVVDGVALGLGVAVVQGVLELHVLVERVVLGRGGLL